LLDPSIKVVLAELIITITVTPDKPEGEAFGFFYYVKSTCGVYQCGLESVDLRKIEINADYTFSNKIIGSFFLRYRASQKTWEFSDEFDIVFVLT